MMANTKLLVVFLYLFSSSSSSETTDRKKRFTITVADTNPEKAKQFLDSQKEFEEISEAINAPGTKKNRRYGNRFDVPLLTKTHSNFNPLPDFNDLPLPNFGVQLPDQLNQVSSASSSSRGSSVSNAASYAKSGASSFISEGGNTLNRLKNPIGELEQFLEKEFDSFKTQFNKVYSTAEEALFRKEIFIENKKKIMKFNEEYGSGRMQFAVRVNEYADLLSHEFNQLFNGFNSGNRSKSQEPGHGSTFIPSANVALPISVDWREAGAVTSVKSQEKCGACYAFSATGALEGQLYRKHGQLKDLSIQNLIDCTRTYGNSGCVGGLMDPAFEYVRDNLGIEADATYPFEATDTQPCRYKREGYAGHDTGYVDIDEGDERGLENAVATIGPISAAIDASLDSFQFYSDGVFYDPKCENAAEKMNHAVLVVGYGTEPDGKQYWIIKNSYGPGWGIGGYMKLAKFANNHCGIATYASYPLV